MLRWVKLVLYSNQRVYVRIITNHWIDDTQCFRNADDNKSAAGKESMAWWGSMMTWDRVGTQRMQETTPSCTLL